MRGCQLCPRRLADMGPRAWAAADLRTLARLIPAQSRLLLGAPPARAAAPSAAAPAEAPAAAVALVASRAPPAAAAAGEDAVEVPTASVRAGDLLLVHCSPLPLARRSAAQTRKQQQEPDARRTSSGCGPQLPVARGRSACRGCQAGALRGCAPETRAQALYQPHRALPGACAARRARGGGGGAAA